MQRAAHQMPTARRMNSLIKARGVLPTATDLTIMVVAATPEDERDFGVEGVG